MRTLIEGRIYVLGDNIDTDQIIPAEYLVYRLSDPQERKLFGKYALSGVPIQQAGRPAGSTPFVAEGKTVSEFRIIVAGKNFGCGSSREHAPFALREAGVEAVIAESYARIFFRNSVNGGYLAPVETPARLIEQLKTGEIAVVDLKKNELRLSAPDRVFSLKPLGDILPILEAGDVFAYARAHGLMPKQG
ncbi:MAG: 3-isopropylmalate dehydratase [Candidatus Sumerlaeota bacterium]|nr:3-isopropylmalate dehydratase [Candidatus Sumerlaeota bacterium]